MGKLYFRVFCERKLHAFTILVEAESPTKAVRHPAVIEKFRHEIASPQSALKGCGALGQLCDLAAKSIDTSKIPVRELEQAFKIPTVGVVVDTPGDVSAHKRARVVKDVRRYIRTGVIDASRATDTGLSA